MLTLVLFESSMSNVLRQAVQSLSTILSSLATIVPFGSEHGFPPKLANTIGISSPRFSSRISLRSSNPAITNFSLQQFGDSGGIDRNNVIMDERDPALNINQEIISERTRILPPSN